MDIEQVATSSLIPYANNARTHSEQQVAQIAGSIREFGFNNPVLIDENSTIIAGHGRVLAAVKLGLDQVPCIRLSHLNESQRKAYILADNKIALNAGWNNELLKVEFEELQRMGFDIDLIGFDIKEIEEFMPSDNQSSDGENPYTGKIDVPVYEPKGDKPPIEELFNDEKAMDLIESIKQSALNEKEKQFLMAAASRHIVFHYDKIANFYAHSSKECQELMENSALVIIDFDKAIENGFVALTKDIDEVVEYDEE